MQLVCGCQWIAKASNKAPTMQQRVPGEVWGRCFFCSIFVLMQSQRSSILHGNIVAAVAPVLSCICLSALVLGCGSKTSVCTSVFQHAWRSNLLVAKYQSRLDHVDSEPRHGDKISWGSTSRENERCLARYLTETRTAPDSLKGAPDMA